MTKRLYSTSGVIIFTLIILSLACSLPVIGGGTSTPTQTVTPIPATPQPTPRGDLPPALVETSPLIGGEVSTDGPVIFTFNQPMDHASVEAAFQSASGLSGYFEWLDDSTLWFYPDTTLQPGTSLDFMIGTEAQAINGRGLLAPISVNFQTVGYLRLTQTLPQPGAQGVNPGAAVVAAFNRPVVPLSADQTDLPPAFRLEPASNGRGEWLNTSTYIFYPEGGLAGGQEYRVILDDDLSGVDGAPLQGVGSVSDGTLPQDQVFTEWLFNTAYPEVIGVEPAREMPLGLDGEVSITFNQPMNSKSVQDYFSMQGPQGEITGGFEWDETFTRLTFSPNSKLERDTPYDVNLYAQAKSAGGTPLSDNLQLAYQTVPEFRVLSSLPQQGGVMAPYGAVRLTLSSLPPDEDLSQYIQIRPSFDQVYAYYNEYEGLIVGGRYVGGTIYTLTVSDQLSDRWGGKLPEPYVLEFSTSDYAADLQVPGSYFSQVIYGTEQDRGLTASAVNISSVALTHGKVPLDDFLQIVGGDMYSNLFNYQPVSTTTTITNFNLPRNVVEDIIVPFNPDGAPLDPGIYYVQLRSQTESAQNPYLLIVSDINLTFKLSATNALVWAINLNDLSAVSSVPVTIYDDNGQSIAQGQTNDQGLFQAEVSSPDDPFLTRFAVLGEPNGDTFSLAVSAWDQGMVAFNQGIQVDYRSPYLKAYVYTDRPIYRPGQTVYFRAVLRESYNGRYSLPEIRRVSVWLYNPNVGKTQEMLLPISEFGTITAEFQIPAETQPGSYQIELGLEQKEESFGGVSFQVAAYRKPEIDLQVNFDRTDTLIGETLTGTVDARYFFGPAAVDVPTQWTLYRQREYFYLPGYQVGPQEADFLRPQFLYPSPVFGDPVQNGSGMTNAQGHLDVEFATESSEQLGETWRYTLEATVQDESELPVSARNQAVVHPAPFYIGVKPLNWNARAGQTSSFDLLTVDWTKLPSPGRTLTARLERVVYQRSGELDPFGYPNYVEQVMSVGEPQVLQTDSQGKARVQFMPQSPGTYRLTVAGSGAHTDVFLWIAGPGDPNWPDLPSNRLELIADQKSYLPGDIATVLIPNPLNSPVPALVSIERGKVLRYETINIPASGSQIEINLSSQDAPNVYISVLLLAPRTYSLGMLRLPVEPVEQHLNVELIGQPEIVGPGDRVNLNLRVTDSEGKPVQGEFSMSVVDEAILALTDPNSISIFDAFYDQQPLGVRTCISLSAYSSRKVVDIGGLGGGGGEMAAAIGIPIRQDFRDTAYWTGALVTDQDGSAEVQVSLPENLTTWQVEVRGLNTETQVGDAQIELLTTKDLIIRPVTPRFLVVEDHLQLAAIVQNNTDQELEGTVGIQVQGFMLDDPGSASQQVVLSPGGRERINWWGTVQDVDEVDLVFNAQAGEFRDASRPVSGSLPVYHFSAPQTFGTSGIMDAGGQLLEVISLPASFDTQGGNLAVELSPSLGAAMLDALDSLEDLPYQSTEQVVSRFLPELGLFEAMQSYGLTQPEIELKLKEDIERSLNQLLAVQNVDGGWNWSPKQGVSDPYVSAYVLFGLSRMKAAGYAIPNRTLTQAVSYLQDQLLSMDVNVDTDAWQLDRAAFMAYALSQVNETTGSTQLLFEMRERLSPWGQAFLMLSLQADSDQARTLLSDLQSDAIRSDTGTHWEETSPAYQNMSSPVFTTSVILYALAERDPASPLIPEATRYVMAHREAQGGWQSTYETSWTLLGISQVMQGTGEIFSDFNFAAEVNDIKVVEGNAVGDARLRPVSASIPVSDLYYRSPNALVIERDSGSGRLYYNVHLELFRPVEEVEAQNLGLSITRAYYPMQDTCEDSGCPIINSANSGELIEARLTITLPHDMYYLAVEDYLPAGAEVLDSRLKTSQLGQMEYPEPEPKPLYNPDQPFADGWGWWLFNDPRVYDDRIAWTVDYLPAGTYELTYVLVLTHAGEYHVLPSRAFQMYFPEVQGNGKGEIFTIGE